MCRVQRLKKVASDFDLVLLLITIFYSFDGTVYLPMSKKGNSLSSTQSATTAVGPNLVLVKVDQGARLVWVRIKFETLTEIK